jgi:hypothetical protein
MKVFKNLSIEVPGTNAHFFNLDEFNDETSNEALYYGYSCLEHGVNPEILKKYERNVYLNVTTPTEFCSPQPTESDDIFDEVYGICPYTNSWLNEIKSKPKYKTIFYPFHKNDIPTNSEKKYDVIYHGGIHGEKYVKMLETIRKFNYRYLSQNFGINQETQQHLRYATDVNLTNSQKLNKISECKISICFNTFDIRNQNDINWVKSRKDWWMNEAFKHVEDLMLAPQFKSRCNEAAFSKTLNLVKRDPWNLIENYYDTDEFVYFDDLDELEGKINEILNNWNQYIPTIEKAYKKSLNYTTENLYKTIKNKESYD